MAPLRLDEYDCGQGLMERTGCCLEGSDRGLFPWFHRDDFDLQHSALTHSALTHSGLELLALRYLFWVGSRTLDHDAFYDPVVGKRA